MTAGKCKSCDAGIVWAITLKGRRMPLDVEPVDPPADLRGLFAIRAVDGVDTALALTQSDLDDGQHAYRSHFATCPNAARHRRSGA